MSAALRQALRVVQQEAPQLANLRSVRTSAAPGGYHYVSELRAAMEYGGGTAAPACSAFPA